VGALTNKRIYGGFAMSNRKLVVLGIIAVVMVTWAVVQSRISNNTETEPSGPVYLVQGLNTADIGSIVLGYGNDAVTLKRSGRQFVVVNKDNYPAKASEINSLISKCLEIQTSELVTDNPDNFDELEVTEEKARSLVKFFTPDPNSTLLMGIVIGKSKEGGQGSYVRLISKDNADSNKVYMAPNVPWFGSQAIDFIDQELISVKRDDIESVTVGLPSGEYTLKTEPNSTNIVMENMPAGKKLKSGEAQNVFTALTSLRFNDVKKQSDDDLTFDKKYVCKLKDATEYTINIAAKDDKTYVTCSSAFTGVRPTTIRQDESEEELKVKEAKLLADDKAKEFTANHQGWIYEIADYKAKNLTKELSDLVEDIEKPQEPNAVETGPLPAQSNK
jgi:hypothetical protein